MSLPTLRDYQVDLADRFRAELLKSGHRTGILQAETGAGKTMIAGSFIRLAFDKGNRALFLASSRELVNQASSTLWDWGVPHGVVMAGVHCDPARVYVASKDTLVSKVFKRKRWQLPDADLVFIDECHESMSSWWLKILKHYEGKGATVIGLTATPARLDGKGLGDFYRVMVEAAPPSKLIKDGWVVPTKVFVPYGDQQKIKEASDLIGDPVTNWKLYGENRQTIIYCATIDHALFVKDQFTRAGIRCDHIDGATEVAKRADLLEAFSDRSIRCLTNIGVLKQGVDLPIASCAICLKKTKSYVFYRQAVGRLKRPYSDGSWTKTYCVWIDHAGNAYPHGHPDDDVHWELSTTSNMTKKNKQRVKDEAKIITCPKCKMLFSGSKQCPECGHILTKQPKARKYKKGTLVEFAGSEQLSPESLRKHQQRSWHTCLAVAANKGGTMALAAKLFKEKWGIWPPKSLENAPAWQNWDWQKKQPVAKLYPGYIKIKV